MLHKGKGKGVALRRGELLTARDDVLHTLREIKRLLFALGGARLEFRKVEHIVHKGGETVCLVDDDLHVFGLVFAGQVAHDLGIADDHGERGAQIVRNVGDQLAAQAIHLGKLHGGMVEDVGKLSGFPIARLAELQVVGAAGKLLGAVADADHGGGDAAGEHPRKQGGEQKQDQGNCREQCHNGLDGSVHRCDGGIQQNEIDAAVLLHDARRNEVQRGVRALFFAVLLYTVGTEGAVVAVAGKEGAARVLRRAEKTVASDAVDAVDGAVGQMLGGQQLQSVRIAVHLIDDGTAVVPLRNGVRRSFPVVPK